MACIYVVRSPIVRRVHHASTRELVFFTIFGPFPACTQHAPIALGAAGARVVVAESYARIFFRNSIATGEVGVGVGGVGVGPIAIRFRSMLYMISTICQKTPRSPLGD